MSKLVKNTPIPIAGLMLALAATGNLVKAYGLTYHYLFGIAATAILMLLVAKIFIYPKVISSELANPIVASVAPTFTMGIMLLTTYLKPWFPGVALRIWLFAIVLHVLLMLDFFNRFILNFNIKKVFPSYFIVFVGIVVASVTSPVYNMLRLGQIIFWFGLASYIVLLPIVLYRVLKVKSIPEGAMPTLCIFAAPASLCLAGYLNSFPEKNMSIVLPLAIVAVFSTITTVILLPRLLKIEFYPSYSALTFPLVISAIALKLTNGFLVKVGKGYTTLQYIMKLEEILAICIVLYVLIHYIKFLITHVYAINESKTA